MLERAAQGGAGVTIPGGIQGRFRCCTEGNGLEGNTDDMFTAGLDDLGSLFHPW